MEFLSQDIKYALLVKKYESMTKAAEVAHVQQAAISRAIQRIEEKLGQQLFIRDSRRIRLSEYGKKYLNSIEEIQQLWLLKQKKFQDDLGHYVGHFKIGMHLVNALNIMPIFLCELLKKYPNLQTDIEIMNSFDVAKKVSDGMLDFGIVINPILFPNLVIKKLKIESIYLCQNKNIKTKAKYLLMNPEMINLHQFIDLFDDYEIRTLPSYDLIALTLLKSNEVVGILPSGILSRYPEIRVLKEITSADLCFICRKENIKNKSTQAIMQIFKSILS